MQQTQSQCRYGRAPYAQTVDLDSMLERDTPRATHAPLPKIVAVPKRRYRTTGADDVNGSATICTSCRYSCKFARRQPAICNPFITASRML